MSQEILNILLSALGIIVTGLASFVVAKVTQWINSKIKDKKAAELANGVLTVITNAVKTVYQEFVEALKKEGKFDAEAQKAAKDKALAIIKAGLTAEFTEFISSTFGDIDAYLANQIEVILYNLKK